MEKNSEGHEQQGATAYEHIVAGQRLLQQQQQLAAQQCFEAASEVLVSTFQHQVWSLVMDALGPHNEVTKRISQAVFFTAYERLPAFPSGHAVWAWLESIAQEHITDAQAGLTELVEALLEVQGFCDAVGQDAGDVYLTAFEKLPTIPRGPGLRRWLRRIAVYKSMQAHHQGRNRHGLLHRHRGFIRATTHTQEMLSPARWLEIRSWWGGKRWSAAEQDWLEKVFRYEWTCTEVVLDYLITAPRTPQGLRRHLAAIQTILVAADREKNQPTLSDKAQQLRVDFELSRRGASAPARRLWEQTWNRVARCIEAGARQL